MIFRPVSPQSPIGPPTTKRPVGLTKYLICLLINSDGNTGLIISSITASVNALGVDYSLTVSCYQADEAGQACGVCDSCRIRKAGFKAANIPDPTAYKAN